MQEGQNLPGTPAEGVSAYTSGNVVANTREIESWFGPPWKFFRAPNHGRTKSERPAVNCRV